ncbi:MAG: ComF family protein [Hyphomicrobiaceae bacterium]|nr:ComF family protein [Hyphomicrobiaceae bacterium]
MTRMSATVGAAALRVARAVADTLIPPLCLSCHRPLADHDALCAKCWSEISFIRAPVCDRLGIPLPYDPGSTDGAPLLSAAAIANPPDYDRARAVAHFDGVVRDLIHGLKYADRHDARRLFGNWLAVSASELLADAELLVPVPLHARRLLARRFNQSAILASELARRCGVPLRVDVLQRRRHTASQVGLTRDQRRQNLQGAFHVPDAARRHIEGRTVLLVDDVITTGTTINACARTLKRAGASRVDVVAIAMVTDESRINP